LDGQNETVSKTLNPNPETWDAEAPFLVVGLGNPGRQYRDTRHNIGFQLVDKLAERLDVSFSRLQFRALLTDVRHTGRRIYLAKPQTYMNESGLAIGSVIRFFKVPLGNLLVVNDDVDLPFGTIRLRPRGGSAGQKGVESIIERLGTQDFPRLRIGVGRPPGRMLAAAYVLQNFSKEEMEFLPPLLDRAADAALLFVTQGLDEAMNKYNASAEA
jgi:peptidyl-tRNA hydrolase, PTH1 family